MDTSANDTLGRRIARLRIAHGMTQERLANILNVSAQAVSKWENDQSYPDIMLLPVLAETFGVSVDDLLGRTVAVRTVEPGPLSVPEPAPEPVHEPERTETSDPRPTKLHICVTERDGVDRVDVALPLTGVRAMANIVGSIPSVRSKVGFDMDELFTAAQSVEAGTLIDVDDGHDHVVITLE